MLIVEQNEPPYPIDISLLGADTIVLDTYPVAKLVQELRFTRWNGERVGFRAHGAASGNRNISRIMNLSRLLYIYTPSRCHFKHLEGVYF